MIEEISSAWRNIDHRSKISCLEADTNASHQKVDVNALLEIANLIPQEIRR